MANEKDREAAALMLRHAGTAVTDRHYVLVSKQEKRAMVARDQKQRAQRKEEAAGEVGAAFRRAVN